MSDEAEEGKPTHPQYVLQLSIIVLLLLLCLGAVLVMIGALTDWYGTQDKDAAVVATLATAPAP